MEAKSYLGLIRKCRVRLECQFALRSTLSVLDAVDTTEAVAEMEGEEILRPHEVQFSELKLLSSSSSSSLDDLKTIMENLGPRGPGLLAVTGVPGASLLRRKLLPLARKLAFLNPDDRIRLLKEHNLGSDVPLKNPDRNVSSFAIQLKYNQGLESTEANAGKMTDQSNLSSEAMERSSEMEGGEFKCLGSAFQELGSLMMEIGLFVARICDRAIGVNELEQGLLESSASKGRLIHYHSALDNKILREASREKGSAKKHSKSYKRNKKNDLESCKVDTNGNEARALGIFDNLWQQWHYDYGVLTVLTDPMFFWASNSFDTAPKGELSLPTSEACHSPSGHSFLQIYDPSKKKLFMVKSSPESFIVQVGESADILSRGKLRSTLHCVRRPPKYDSLSRETFVVFLQPSWRKTFSVLDCRDHWALHYQHSEEPEENNLAEPEENALSREIQKIVPPLSSRLKDGMTFAEFSRETTKQYYGSSGLQSDR